ncbi:hypothetical protein D9619_010160 [Psilocybe cf. subviscida]|uniref:Uncharacterized protein n=1 Tax=Psilocybe cf. subviscida TaxID=2480587 RepID=A0A8H5ERS3_9AGAR|nr:hypothetical protein D9619_010160 [Psilocybe cf. subviscida]
MAPPPFPLRYPISPFTLAHARTHITTVTRTSKGPANFGDDAAGTRFDDNDDDPDMDHPYVLGGKTRAITKDVMSTIATLKETSKSTQTRTTGAPVRKNCASYRAMRARVRGRWRLRRGVLALVDVRRWAVDAVLEEKACGGQRLVKKGDCNRRG